VELEATDLAVSARCADEIVVVAGVHEIRLSRADVRWLIHRLSCAHTAALGLAADETRRTVGHA
jgi:hypothetical protein